jgi:archaellum component FlaC
MKDEFAKLESALNTLESKAPAEIKGDVDTLASAVKKLAALYSKAGYDSSKMSDAVAADPAAAADAERAVADPSFSAAASHIESYFEKNCS